MRAYRDFRTLLLTPSGELVDAVVAAIRDRLEWRKPEVATPTPPPQPPVRMVQTRDGLLPELPLDADEATMRAAKNVDLLRDLSKRRGEGQSWFSKVGRSAGDITTDSSRRSGTSQVR